MISTAPPPLPLTSLAPGLPPTVRAAFAPLANPAAAQAYTRELAHSHYENFSVVTFLLPRHLRQDFCNVYAFCRVADDLGDEVPDRQLATQYLRGFSDQLNACYAGQTTTAVFVALRETILRHDIPIEPFAALIDAFVQDQTVNRYSTMAQLHDYCRRSADPVGRLVLYMTGYRDEQRQKQSDHTCTALQLANFWQDVRRDLQERDRIYIPEDVMSQFGVNIEQIRSLKCDDRVRAMMRELVAQTHGMLNEGAALLPMLKPSVRRQVALFGEGGRAILRAIERQGYDTFSSRPSLSKMQKGRLVARALLAALRQKILGERGAA